MIDGYTEQELAFIIQLKEGTDKSWSDIVVSYNKKFKKNKNFDAVKKAYYRNKDYFLVDDNHIKTLRDIHRTKRNSGYKSKENRVILDHWMKREDLVDTIKNTVKSIAVTKYKPAKYKSKLKKKKNMTLEVLISDTHYGKYIDSIDGNYVDNKVIRERMKKVSRSVIKEIHRESKSFNVERIIIAMIGDMIENANFHGMESNKSCEFSTSRQVQEAITSLFYDLILPVAMTGIDVYIPCVTGNHDRIDKDKTYLKPGEDNLTYIIYKTLEVLCDQSGLKNVKFDIATGLYTHYAIYNNVAVIEHGDELRNLNRETCVNQMNRRQSQIGKVVNFFRFGHWHELVQYGQGRIIGNGSVPGQDSYAESKGFSSEPAQVLNYYVQTDKRDTCFFRSFPIYLKNKQ